MTAQKFNWSKFLVSVLVVLGIGAVVVDAILKDSDGSNPKPGTPAPPFVFSKYGGGTVTSEDLKGKTVMLDFWATWCAPCVEEMPILVKLAKEYENRGLAFVAASQDEGETAKVDVGLFVTDKVPGLANFAVFDEGNVGSAYRIKMLPTLFLIDAQGNIVSSHRGMMNEKALREAIERALPD